MCEDCICTTNHKYSNQDFIVHRSGFCLAFCLAFSTLLPCIMCCIWPCIRFYIRCKVLHLFTKSIFKTRFWAFKLQLISMKLAMYLSLVLIHPKIDNIKSWIRQQRGSISIILSWEGGLFKRMFFLRAYGMHCACNLAYSWVAGRRPAQNF